MNKSQNIAELTKALCKVQKEIKKAVKDSNNPFFKSKYADLGSVWDACRDALSSNGLAVCQTLGDGSLGPTLVTTLLHESGEWIEGSQPVLAKSQDPQGLGSAITYARRYGLSAIVGIVQEDDDGERGMSRTSSEVPIQQRGPQIPYDDTPPIGDADLGPPNDAAMDILNGTDHELAGYIVPAFAKKYAGKKFKDIQKWELKGYANYFKNSGKPIKPDMQTLIDNIQEYTK